MTAAPVLIPGAKVLIAYFTKTGLTKRVVDVLQPLIQADVYKIETEVSYIGFFGAVKGAYHSLKAVQGQKLGTDLPDLAKYDVFIVACPIWNFRQPPPVSAFLAAADFAGKPVIGLSTAHNKMKAFNQALEKEIRNGRFIAKEAFYDVGGKSEAALAEAVNQWMNGL
jgi:flavodoxin